ncbi:MAG TPA: hypothetical protein VJQ82_12215 [Terriglobales bacterium]|nr:hypothetical protein [Terriglobales bacterium]
MKHRLSHVLLTMICLMIMRLAPQQQTYSPAALERPRQIERSAESTAAPGPQLYRRHYTWYEFLLKRFNPTDFDYGTWMEERRQALLDASARNPYFKYCWGLTIVLMLTVLLYAKQRIDHRRLMWVTAEMMTDLYNHDSYSHQVAENAIQKYNDHIERCNRAIEATEHGSVPPGTESDVQQLGNELARVTRERELYLRERDSAKAEVVQQKQIVVELSQRLDTIAKKSSGSGNSPADLRTADEKLVQHINELQEQLVAARKEIRRLKGA